jgi:Zn-finger nucleic acid-binding protein
VPSNQLCPRCACDLTQHHLTGGVCAVCPSCRGRTVALALIRKHAQPGLASRLWLDARSTPPAGAALACPSCRLGMAKCDLCPGVELDLCRQCQSLWFDGGEFDHVRMERRALGKGRPSPPFSGQGSGDLLTPADRDELSGYLLGSAFDIISALG